MSAGIAHDLQSTTETRATTRSPRVRLVLALGPFTAVAGLAWAVWQPWRMTLLHPHAQGFWWLVAEPPLYVVLVGVLFRLLIAPGLVKDLQEDSSYTGDRPLSNKGLSPVNYGS